MNEITLETWSHISGVMGIIAVIVTSILTWRKGLLKNGFDHFQEIYVIQMTEFKKTVRDYVNQNDARNSRTLDRVAELYEKTHVEIEKYVRAFDIFQERTKVEKIEEENWKRRVDKDLKLLTQKIDHIDKVVNNKKRT